ncbi:MAG: hypothetical protein AABW67_05985 [Nanoarchaeota archaeon]
MKIGQSIKEYLTNQRINKEKLNKGYWIAYTRTGLLNDISLTDTQDYDGKYKVHRTFEQIEALVPNLIELLRNKRISGFKYKSRDTPICPDYADKLPPLFIYLKERQIPEISSNLNNLGLEDKVWINDTRTALDFQVKAQTNN